METLSNTEWTGAVDAHSCCCSLAWRKKSPAKNDNREKLKVAASERERDQEEEKGHQGKRDRNVIDACARHPSALQSPLMFTFILYPLYLVLILALLLIQVIKTVNCNQDRYLWSVTK